MFAPFYGGANFLEPEIMNDPINFTMSILLCNDDDGSDSISVLECCDRMRDYGFAGDFGEKLVEAHAMAAARGHDDGSQHDKMLKVEELRS